MEVRLAKYMDPFLKHRKAQEQKHLDMIADGEDPFLSLMTVEMNITELCNRKCVFCPRVDPEVYPNRNLMMDLAVSRKVAKDLSEVGYLGRISFSGFGEPLLNREFAEHIRVFREALPENTIETNTNGDRLTVATIHELFEAGLTGLYINMYDGPEQEPEFLKMIEEAGLTESQWRLRPHWVGSDKDFGLTLNNRSGVLRNAEFDLGPLDSPLQSRCHYPFYKLLIDWDGKALFCSNDWGREIRIGDVMTTHVVDVWLSEKMFEVRRYLSEGQRCFSPCKQCNVTGTLTGGKSFDLLMQYYERQGRFDAKTGTDQ